MALIELQQQVQYFKSKLEGESYKSEEFMDHHPEMYPKIKTLISETSKHKLNIPGSLDLKINLARVAIFSLSDFDLGFKWAQEAYEEKINRAIIAPLSEARLYNILGNASYNDTHLALAWTLKAVSILETLEGSIARSELLYILINNLPAYYLELGDLTHTFDSLKKAECLLKEFNHPSYHAIFHTAYGTALLRQGDQHKAALDHFNQSLNWVETGKLMAKAYRFVLIGKAEALMQRAKYDESLEILLSLEEQYFQSNLLEFKFVRIKILQGFNYFKKRQCDQAVERIYQALNLCKNLIKPGHYVFLQGQAHFMLGEIYEKQDNLKQAWQEYKTAEHIYNSLFTTEEFNDVKRLNLKISNISLDID